MLVRKQTRRWHAALAGAVAGGLAILWETRSRRAIIAQQMFVRCFLFSQGYSALKMNLLFFLGKNDNLAENKVYS
jgi:hypothetical protein